MEGIITAIHGDVIEVQFENGLPNIHDALIVKKSDGAEIILEVHDHINNTSIKCIALGFTQGSHICPNTSNALFMMPCRCISFQSS
jgi:F-type H+/Na+-transporting ATPase subunit beta